MSKHVSIPLKKPRIASLSGKLSRPTHTAPIVAMRKGRCLSSPQTPTSWST